MDFEQVVRATPDISSAYQKGLSALGANSSKIQLKDMRLTDGSVDIDSATKKKYPNASRWDYCFSYKGEVFFVEVHTANSREVKKVLNKLVWLKGWLNTKAPELNKLKVKNQPAYYWIQSKKFAIPKSSSQYRLIERSEIKPISALRL